MIEETLQEIASAIENLDTNPDNSFGETIGDTLYNLAYQVQRIADILEKIEQHM